MTFEPKPDTPESPDLDPEFTPAEDVAQDKRGALMSEIESWERVIEGLKSAADGARQIARHRAPDLWNKLAAYLDSLRKAVIRDGGFDRPADAVDSKQVWGGEGMSFTLAHRRLMDGLKAAAAGARQISLGQRMDLRWSLYAEKVDKLRDKAHALALKGSPLVTEAGWRNHASGLLVPARLN